VGERLVKYGLAVPYFSCSERPVLLVVFGDLVWYTAFWDAGNRFRRPTGAPNGYGKLQERATIQHITSSNPDHHG
jgi:hypothetical protein